MSFSEKTTLSFKEGIREINMDTFRKYDCSNLKKIIIPNSVERIDYFPWFEKDNGSKLSSITLPFTIKEINICALNFCDTLNNITITKGRGLSHPSAFKECPRIDILGMQIPCSYFASSRNAMIICGAETAVHLSPDLWAMTKYGKEALSSSTRYAELEKKLDELAREEWVASQAYHERPGMESQDSYHEAVGKHAEKKKEIYEFLADFKARHIR